MPPDPNAKLIKAIESLTRSVDENTKQVKEAVRLGKQNRGFTTFRSYQEGEEYVDPATVHNEGTDSSESGTSSAPS